MPSILVVDDDESVRESLVDFFKVSNFIVYQAGDVKQAIGEAHAKMPSAIIMDLNLPDQSGFDAVESLKRDPTTCGIPILVFTAHHQDGQLIESREHGADGYLIKGGPWEEVLGYIQLLIRSSAAQNVEKFSLGPITINLNHRTVHVFGRPTPPLTPKEFDLLVFIAQKSPQVFPWEKIATAVWNEPAKYGKNSKTIELHAQRIRKKLGPDAGKFILTHKGVGLQLLASIPSSPA